MLLPELGEQIQGECYLTLNNQIIRISAGWNNRESTVHNREGDFKENLTFFVRKRIVKHTLLIFCAFTFFECHE